MGFDFWRREKELTDAQKHALAQKRLRAQFADAAGGHSFRTLAYIPPKQGRVDYEWLAAHRIAAGQWAVFRYIQLDPRTDPIAACYASSMLRLQEAYPQSHNVADFLRAVELLTAYEETQEKLGWTLRAQPDLKELGNEHVRAFAEREGIIFDTEGNPHPTTLDGVPIATAVFTEAALAKAKKAKADKSLLLLSLPLNGGKDRNRLRQLMLESAMMTSMHELRNFVQEACRAGWSGKAAPVKGLSDSFNKKHEYRGYFFHIYFDDARDAFRERFDFLLKQEESSSLLARHYALFEFYVILSAARRAFENKGKKVEEDNVYCSIMFDDSNYRVLKSMLARKLKLFTDSPIKESLLEDLIKKEKSVICPPELDEIIFWFKNYFSTDRTVPGAEQPRPMPVPALK